MGKEGKLYIEQKNYTVVEMLEGEWSKLYKTDIWAKKHLRESFAYKRPLHQDQVLDNIKTGALFGYVKGDIKIPEHLREQIANFQNKQTYVDKILNH